MADQLILKSPDEQADGENYKFILRVIDGQAYYLTAVDTVEISECGTMMMGTRGGEVVTTFSIDLSFSLNIRTDFKTRSRLELYEEELEIQVEANKFGENAKRILGLNNPPSSGYQE